MTATGHALVGASIAYQIGNPAISLPLALASHFLFDKLPHWDVMTRHKDKTRSRIFLETTLDTLVGYVLIALIFGFILKTPNLIYIFLVAFIAQLPDWLEIPYVFLHSKLFPFYQNYLAQKWIHNVWFDARLPAPWGVVTQLVVVIVFISWVLLAPSN